MKKVVVPHITAILVGCALNCTVSCQNLSSFVASNISTDTSTFSSPFGMHIDSSVARELRRNEINLRALRNFTRNYHEILDAKWYQCPIDLTVVSFTKNGIRHHIHYSKMGFYESMIRFYGEKQLPPETRHLIRSNFYDFSIVYVTEINRNDQTVYVVKLEDPSKWKTLTILGTHIEIIDEYVKQ